MISAAGETLVNMFPCGRYRELIAEAVEPFSYMKVPYYRKDGYPNGIYRVGPLARLNLAAACGTPCADEALAEFRHQHPRPVLSSFHYHSARLIEIVFAVERMQELLSDPTILDPFVRARAAESSRRHRHCRSAARDADSPLQD